MPNRTARADATARRQPRGRMRARERARRDTRFVVGGGESSPVACRRRVATGGGPLLSPSLSFSLLLPLGVRDASTARRSERPQNSLHPRRDAEGADARHSQQTSRRERRDADTHSLEDAARACARRYEADLLTARDSNARLDARALTRPPRAAVHASPPRDLFLAPFPTTSARNPTIANETIANTTKTKARRAPIVSYRSIDSSHTYLEQLRVGHDGVHLGHDDDAVLAIHDEPVARHELAVLAAPEPNDPPKGRVRSPRHLVVRTSRLKTTTSNRQLRRA